MPSEHNMLMPSHSTLWWENDGACRKHGKHLPANPAPSAGPSEWLPHGSAIARCTRVTIGCLGIAYWNRLWT